MREGFPPNSLESKRTSSPLVEKLRKAVKIGGLFLSVFLAAHHDAKAQGKVTVPIKTSDKSKVNAYLDSLDFYESSKKEYEQSKKIELSTIESDNKIKKSSDKIIEYEENIVPPFNKFPQDGPRSGIKMFPEHGIEMKEKNSTNGVTSSIFMDVFKQPVQPYESVPVQKWKPVKHKIVKLSPHDLLKLNVVPTPEKIPKESIEIPELPPIISETDGFFLKIHTFDPTLQNPSRPTTLYFETERQRQEWLKENAGHLQKEGRGGIDFLDTDTIPNKEK